MKKKKIEEKEIICIDSKKFNLECNDINLRKDNLNSLNNLNELNLNSNNNICFNSSNNLNNININNRNDELSANNDNILEEFSNSYSLINY